MLSIFCNDTGRGRLLPFAGARRGGCEIEAEDTVEPALLYPAGGSSSVASGVPLAWKNFAFDTFSSDLPILEAPDEYPDTMLPDAFDELPLACRSPDCLCVNGRGRGDGAGEALASLA